MSQEKEILGKDLKLMWEDPKPQLGLDLSLSGTGDLEAIADELNLGQAIGHRLLTNIGELFDTGHSTYGSRLYELVGEPNNETTRERARAIVREALQQEPRIKEIFNILVTTRKGSRDVIDIDITVIAIGSNVPLNIVFPFHLEVA
jgi:phage baseplate assembly protein W